MFMFFREPCKPSDSLVRPDFEFRLEPLEDRRLLSASFHHGQIGGSGNEQGQILNTIEFSQAPTAVQTGLDALATADSLADPGATQSVKLDDVDGVEIYSVTITGTGTTSTLTVDENGNPVTAPTKSKTTWGTLDGTGTGSDAAAAAEISAIASALNLTAPASTTVVHVTTYSDGITIYSVNLIASTGRHAQSTEITVDGTGNPVGNQKLPFDVIPATIQEALNTNAPTGATAIATTSTQTVNVKTADGVTTYSTKFTVSGTTTTVTVNSSGELTSLPGQSTTEFQDLPTAAQTEIQTLATDYGVSETISDTQSVDVYTESSGTVIYSVTLDATGTDDSGNAYTFALTVSVDEDGNPTTLPGDANGGGPDGGGCDGGDMGGPGPGDFGPPIGRRGGR
jgi:hypothetical protein